MEINVILCLLFNIISESVLENYSGLLILLIKCLAGQGFVTGLYCTPVVPGMQSQGCIIMCLWLAILNVRPSTFHFFLHGGWGGHNSARVDRGKLAWPPLPLCGFWKLNSGHQAWCKCLYPLGLLAGPRAQISKRLHQMPIEVTESMNPSVNKPK